MIKKYKRSDKLRLSKNFRLDEFKCKCGKCDPILVDESLVDWLQKIRDHFGRSVNINSGYRCAKHNADPKVDGNPGSHHMQGMAADIRVEGITPEEVAKYAESIGIQRIGLYNKRSFFVHIGSGATKKFWLNDSTNEVDTFGGRPETVTLELPVQYVPKEEPVDTAPAEQVPEEPSQVETPEEPQQPAEVVQPEQPEK